MNCDPSSNDNRETCALVVPSSCIPYTGIVTTVIDKDLPACRPNINDVFTSLQTTIDKIQTSLGDNTTLVVDCMTSINPATATQSQINQAILVKLCALQELISGEDVEIDPSTILITINMLCLINEECEPQTAYTLTEILTMLVTAYCDLLSRVKIIETFLNL